MANTTIFHSRKIERLFNDAFIVCLALDIMLMDDLNADLVLPTYYRYENEYTDATNRFAPIRQVLSKSDLAFFQTLVQRGHTVHFATKPSLREWLKREVMLTDCDLHALNQLNFGAAQRNRWERILK